MFWSSIANKERQIPPEIPETSDSRNILYISLKTYILLNLWKTSKCKMMVTMIIVIQSLTSILPTPMSFLEGTCSFHTPATTASFFIYIEVWPGLASKRTTDALFNISLYITY